MVQRKVPNKFGIQADDHVKSDKRLGNLNLNLKQTSCHHQDGRNRGSDMKKKMKRSRSIKLSDTRTFKLSLGKPPPLTAATPEKQRMIKTTGQSPNYMKATSSSEARKEHSQVSSLCTPTGLDSKNLRRRNSSNSKISSSSSNKPARTLSKSSSLKMVRTLTKSPNFKPVRSTAKKCSRVALCADTDVQKATCSSTLKDSKFPSYLMLNPGGTEAEGTSVLKVCTYTYCSLNGHHHTPLPPLKCFLKTRRRSLKAQKSANLEVLSPRRTKPSCQETEEIRSEETILSDDKPAHVETDSTYWAKFPLVKEVDKDFFIEIYAKNTADGTEAIEKHTEDDEGTIGVAGETDEENISDEAAAEQDGKKQIAENLSDASPYLEVDFEENTQKNNYVHSEEMWITRDFLEQQEAEDAEADYPPILAQDKANTERRDRDSEGESHASMEEDGNISEAIDMEWEEGHPSASEINTETHHLDNLDEESYINFEYQSDFKQPDSSDEPEITRSDDIVIHCPEEILVYEALQELFYEESASSGTLYNDRDSEIESMMKIWEILESEKVEGDLKYDQVSFVDDAFEVPTYVEEKIKEAEIDLTDGMTTLTSIDEPIVESATANKNVKEDGVYEIVDILEKNPHLGDAENDCDTNLVAEDLNGYQNGKYLKAEDTCKLLQSQISDSPQISDESDNDETYQDQKPKETEADQNLAVCASSPEELSGNEAGDPIEEQAVNGEWSLGIQISDSTESSFEANKDDAKVDDTNQNHITTEAFQLKEIAKDSWSSQEMLDENSQAMHCDHQLFRLSKNINVAKNQNSCEEDQVGDNKFKTPTSTYSEEQSDSRTYKISSTRNDEEEENIEVEVCTKSDGAETLLAANNRMSAGSDSTFLHRDSNSGQEDASTCNNRKRTIKCKKPVMDLESEREFNPREPNFLPVVPDPEAEKVDLRHQIMDDRKNSEEWMLDYALQQAVTKLAPARKRKVALLVEAFEKVLPVPKYENHIPHTSAAFSHARPIQACS